MGKKALAISKIILASLMFFVFIYEFIFRLKLLTIRGLVFECFDISSVSLTFGGVVLLIDGILFFFGKKASPILYRNVALFSLFALMNFILNINFYNGLFEAEDGWEALTDVLMLSFYGERWYVIIARIIAPIIILGIYLLDCEEKKPNFSSYMKGFISMPLFVGVQAIVTIGTNFYVFYELSVQPITSEISLFGLDVSSPYISIPLIILSIMVANLLLINLNNFKSKTARRPKASYRKLRNV